MLVACWLALPSPPKLSLDISYMTVQDDHMTTTNGAENMIDKYQDIIDSGDIIERIEYLRGLEGIGDEDEQHEVAALEKLASEASDYAEDWEYGVTLIRDSYFKEYAMELADDIGAVPNDVTWPLTCIDWAQAARELRMDYTAVDFDGVTYWVR